MKKSIEMIWKEGFSEQNIQELPEPLNFQKQTSIHLIDRINKMMKVNFILIVLAAIVFLIVFYFMKALVPGICNAALLLWMAGYCYYQMKHLRTINQGLSTYDYLKQFDAFLKNALLRLEKIMRFFYPLMFLIAMSVIWFAGNNEKTLTGILTEKFPNLKFIGGIPLPGILFTAFVMFLFFYFADKIYRWDVNLIYGRVFKKLEENISEIEKMKVA